jgi:hypothetical protein
VFGCAIQYMSSQRAIESQIWENVIPTVVTICILRFLLEVACEELVAIEMRVFKVGENKNSFGETSEKLPNGVEKTWFSASGVIEADGKLAKGRGGGEAPSAARRLRWACLKRIFRRDKIKKP